MARSPLPGHVPAIRRENAGGSRADALCAAASDLPATALGSSSVPTRGTRIAEDAPSCLGGSQQGGAFGVHSSMGGTDNAHVFGLITQWHGSNGAGSQASCCSHDPVRFKFVRAHARVGWPSPTASSRSSTAAATMLCLRSCRSRPGEAARA